MPDEALALSTIPPAQPAQGDYDAICGTLMRSERGRWFLQEYAKRNRNADTDVLLVAIHRLEAVVRTDKEEHGRQSLRSDLLDMAKAITRTRAEVAAIRPSAAAVETGPARDALSGPPLGPAPIPGAEPAPARNDVLAAAERIRDVTWAMRGHGFDPGVCQQLEELASTILSTSSPFGNPADHRTRKLTEVLAYLERRINGLLDESTQAIPDTDGAPHAAAHVSGYNNSDPDRIDETSASGPLAWSEPETIAAEPSPSVGEASVGMSEQARADDGAGPPTRAQGDSPPAAEPGSDPEGAPRPNRLAHVLLPDRGLRPLEIVLRPARGLAVAREASDSALLLGIDTMTTLSTLDTPVQVAAAMPAKAMPAETGPLDESRGGTAPVEAAFGEAPQPPADPEPIEPIETGHLLLADAPAEAPAPEPDATPIEMTVTPEPQVAGAPANAPVKGANDVRAEALPQTRAAAPTTAPGVETTAVARSPHDPLAMLMAMSEAELIALFS